MQTDQDQIPRFIWNILSITEPTFSVLLKTENDKIVTRLIEAAVH